MPNASKPTVASKNFFIVISPSPSPLDDLSETTADKFVVNVARDSKFHVNS